MACHFPQTRTVDNSFTDFISFTAFTQGEVNLITGLKCKFGSLILEQEVPRIQPQGHVVE